MSENKITFDPKFRKKIESLASLILKDPTKDEMEIPGFGGGVLTLTSRDEEKNTEAFENQMKGDRLSTGPIEIEGKSFCIFS